jgi:hypothetical protein
VPSPYRAPEKEAAPEPKSGELVYRPVERVDRSSAGSSGFKLVAIPTAVGVVLGAAVAVEAGVVGFLVAIAGVVYWSKRHPKDVVVLKVSGGELRVHAMGSAHEAFSVKLDDLDDIVLETKEVQRVMDIGANVVNIGMGPIAPSVASPSETKRIVLEPAKGSPHELTKEFFGHAETTEWFGKVRKFLRDMGWTPLSEREEQDDEDEDEDVPDSSSEIEDDAT